MTALGTVSNMSTNDVISRMYLFGTNKIRPKAVTKNPLLLVG